MKTNYKIIIASILLAGFVTFGFQASTSLASSGQEASASEAAKIEKIVIATIEKYPELIIKSLQKAMEKEQKQQLELATAAIKDNQKVLFSDPNIPSAGNPQGDIKIVTFFDYNCGYCKKSSSEIQALLKSDPNIRVFFRELPILGSASLTLAKIALAANLQGKYLEVHDALMNSGEPVDEAKALNIAKTLGLNMDKLKKDMNGPEIQKMIKTNLNLAETLSINATPSFIVEETFVPGYISKEAFKELILEKRQSTAKKNVKA